MSTDRPRSPPPSPDDRVAAIRAGDVGAFESLFREHYAHLRAFALTLVRSEEVAEDLVEDLFVRIWERREEWEISGSLESYLYTAVRNRALNHLERARTVDRLHAAAEAEGRRPAMSTRPRTPEEELGRADLDEAVRAAIEALPDRAREAFVLHRHHGRSQAEIAEIMGVSPRTVENHVARAVRLLREALEPWL